MSTKALSLFVTGHYPAARPLNRFCLRHIVAASSSPEKDQESHFYAQFSVLPRQRYLFPAPVRWLPPSRPRDLRKCCFPLRQRLTVDARRLERHTQRTR